jgi:hypothetical protein
MRATHVPRGTRRAPVLGLALAIAALPACHQAPLTAPVGSTMTMVANPPFVTANGECAVISVVIVEPAGTFVPDGTSVQFLASLGRVDERGETNDGIARVNFCSDARSGTARISAFSGAATANVEVTVGSVRPSRVSMAALDGQIRLYLGESIANFKATVLDASGNPVARVPVRFSVVDAPATDLILDGADKFTDNNGEVFSRVQTTRTTAGTIRVRAEALVGGAVSGELTIAVVAVRP